MKRQKQAALLNENEHLKRLSVRRVRWPRAHRLIPSRYPPIDIFERVAGREDWDALYALEALTNPRLREAAGEISNIPKERRVSGPGASIVMAPFTHFSRERPTRFSDGTFGVYYTGREFETALREVAFHMGRFHAKTKDPPLVVSYRCYVGKIDKAMHDLTKGDWAIFLDPDVARYGPAQALGKALRERKSNGIVYPSVRNPGGECIAAFYPDVVKIPAQERHVDLHWNSNTIDKWFDHERGVWSPLGA